MKSKSGFTLIELLVVIAIIGILSAVVLASLNSARAKARNSQRLSDVQELGKAFALAYDATNSYPPTSTYVCVSTSCGTNWSGYTASPTVDAAIAPFIAKPTYPIGTGILGSGYLYNSADFGGTVSGLVFPPGAYIVYEVEGSCPVGQLWLNAATYNMCKYKLP